MTLPKIRPKTAIPLPIAGFIASAPLSIAGFIAAALLALIISLGVFSMSVYASTGSNGGGSNNGVGNSVGNINDNSNSDSNISSNIDTSIIAISGISEGITNDSRFTYYADTTYGGPASFGSRMIVNATWLDDEMLRIDIIDLMTGTVSSLAVRLSDFIADADNSPYILIQAVDLEGNLSGVIQISNPFYVYLLDNDNAREAPGQSNTLGATGQNSVSGATSQGITSGISGQNCTSETSQSNVSGASDVDGVDRGDSNARDDNAGESNVNDNGGADNGNGSANDDNVSGDANYNVSAIPAPGLTPDGTGTVADNITTQNEIEFFTVFTEEGNAFFLIIDRQRNTDNVYLLNAVTEADLMALAERSGISLEDSNVSAIPTPPTTEPTAPNENDPEPEEIPEPESNQSSGGGNGNLIFILIAAVAVGGAGYYFKIVRPKRNAVYDDEDFEDDVDDVDDVDDEDSYGDYGGESDGDYGDGGHAGSSEFSRDSFDGDYVTEDGGDER